MADTAPASVPLPPPDVKEEFTVRTLASDIDLLAKSGGLLSSSQAGVAVGVSSGPSVPSEPETKSAARTVFLIAGIVAAAGLLFYAGYSLLPRFLARAPEAPAPQPQVPVSPASGLPGAETEEAFTHESAFRAADETLNVDFYTIPVPFTRAIYLEQANVRLSAARPASSFFELSILGPANRPLSWIQFVNLLGAGGIGTDVFAESFEPDFTGFVYRDGRGAWPGYVLKLKKGKAPLVVQKDLLPIESATSSIAELFFSAPGAPVATFKDAQLSAQPVRSLLWAPSGATFSYGWFFGQYLVLSTSDAGLKAAVERL